MSSRAAVSVLFSDVVDSTATAARLGPESAESLRRTYFGLLRSGVTAAGGTEVKSIGDGLMVVFPSVSAALACGVTTQQEIDRYNQVAAEPLRVRIGISFGEVDLIEDDYFGTPVVEAARLCALAQGGQILTCELVRQVVGGRGDHEFVSLGPRELKGLPLPVEVCSVVWASAPGAPLPPRLDYDQAVRFSGREQQLETLNSALKEVRGGTSKLVLVSGEAGIGKTRLATELARGANDDGATVLYGRCDEDLGVAYQPWIESLGHLVCHAPDSLLAEYVEAHGGELLRLVPGLQARRPEVVAPPESDPEAERYLLFGAVTALLASASALAPVVLVLDDLHWGDKPTLLLLKHLVASRSVSRLLIIATYRDTDLSASDPLADVLADLRRESGVERLALSGLADFELIELLHVLTGHDVDDRGVEIAHALSRETDGNPFFMLELLRHFAESNVFVQRDDGRWTMQGEFTDLGIPQSIREVVGRRVARLGEGAVRALGAAAVIGRDFDLDLLDAITNAGEEELLDVLDAALQAGIVSEVTGAAERYTFSHALIEHTLYDDLSAARRRRVHLRVAEALEALPLDRRMHRVGELAYHWAEATRALDSAKAVDYARLAGERALAQLAPDEAVRWYDQALELLKQQPDYAARTHAELLIGLGTAQRHGGDRAFRDTLLGAANVAATAGADDLLVRAALANSRGQVSSVNQLDTARVAVLRDAIRVSEPHSSERARLLVLQATEMSHAVHADEIEPLVEEGIAIARRVGNPATLSQVLHLAHGALMVPSNLAERIDRTAENLVLSEQLGDPIGRWSASFDRVLTMMQIGDVAEVDRHLGIVQALAAGIDEPGLRYFAATLAAGRALTAGRFAEVEAAANEILDIGSRSGQPDVLTLYGAFLLSLRRDQGRIAELIDMIATMVEDNPAITLARPSLAMCFSELDRLDEAREIFTADAANHFSHLLYNTAGWITGVCFYSEVCARLDAAEAAGELTTMLEPYADHIACGGQFCSGSVRYYLGLLATTRRDFDTADLHFSEALTANERIGSPVWSARSRIEWARMLLMRRRPGDDSTARELLEHAHAVGEALGAAALERRATELLNA